MLLMLAKKTRLGRLWIWYDVAGDCDGKKNSEIHAVMEAACLTKIMARTALTPD